MARAKRQATHFELLEQALDAGAQDSPHLNQATEGFSAFDLARDAYEQNEIDNHYEAHRVAGTENHDISKHCSLCRYCPVTRGW